MKRSGTADLPLHYGQVPPWLYERMSRLGLAIVEVILADYGKDEVLRRLADPFWFQSFGAVMGMDWHSSGITTSVMGALKRAINPNSKSLGIYIAGGKGKFSKDAPNELLRIADSTGLDGNELVRCSKLSAKVDNTAIQDGYQLYLHNFILSDQGNWAVVQQGMHDFDGTARRYHWLSENVTSFVNEPHTGISGVNRGNILNLTSSEAEQNRNGIIDITKADLTVGNLISVSNNIGDNLVEHLRIFNDRAAAIANSVPLYSAYIKTSGVAYPTTTGWVRDIVLPS